VFRTTKTKAIIFVPLVVLATISFFLAVSYLITVIIVLPLSLALPLPARLSAFLPIALGLILIGWLFKYRNPIDIIVSTYVTIGKAVQRTPLRKQSGRTEPLIIIGPHKHIRHPIYFSVVLLILGWWILLDYNFLFLTALFQFLWFRFVVIPFEERELIAIFGNQYESYMREVPSLIPFTKRRKTNKL
jgi:protein-S-isoprenylcysteine O-methyltransferase Ste14